MNLNITSYEDEKRITHNPLGRAYSSTVWEFYQVKNTYNYYYPINYNMIGRPDVLYNF